MNAFTRILVPVTAVMLTLSIAYAAHRPGAKWTKNDVAELASMSLSALEPLPADPTNKYADDPRAAEFGRKLFFDERLSSNGKVACATCHKPNLDFQDGTALAQGVGVTNRRTMPIAGTAHAPFLFWDGRKDSLWAQALGPLESPVEHGGNRSQYAKIIATHYRGEYQAIFGNEPHTATANGITRVFVNVGKAIAAYERRIEFAPSPFDHYVDELVQTGREPSGVLSSDEVAGLKLFTGKAQCTKCHNGPLLTNNDFHNTGVPAGPTPPPDRGRFSGTSAVLEDEFNCRSRWSDAEPAACRELDAMRVSSDEQDRAFKVPSLRDVGARAPYMHAGQLATLKEVLEHYNRAPKAPAGHTELEPLNLAASELWQLETFLRSLSGGTVERLGDVKR
jgi:cytochrome c peroxidase